mgnify:FL=1
MIAGVNVARLGVISYLNAESDLGRLAYSRRDLLLFSIWGLAQRWHQRELFLPEIICYQKYSFCSYWYRDNYFIFNFGKYLWIPYDKDGCGYYYFIWLLSSSNVIQ